MRDSSIPWARGVFPALLLLVGLQTALVGFTGWPASTGEFWGPDSYMRLARTLECQGGAACPEGLFTPSNAPFGETIHWPFLQDRIFLAGAAPLRPLLGEVGAVLTAASLFGPLLGVAAVLLLFWATVPLVGRPGLYFAGPLLLLQPWVFQSFAPARVDHHGLQGVLFLAGVACAVRLLGEPGRRRWAWLGGGAVGLAFWVSTEALVSCLPILVGVGLFWVVRGGGEAARANRRLTLGALGVLTLGLLLDGPPGETLAPLYDRFSVVHWALFVLMALFWAGVERIESRRSETTPGRLGWAAAGALATAGVMTVLFPSFLVGPMAELDPLLWSVWLDHTSEFQPAFGHAEPVIVALHLTSSLLSVPAALCCALRQRGGAARAWAFLAGTLLWLLGLTLFLHGRWGLYLHLLAPLPLAWLVGAGITAIRRLRNPLGRATLQVGLVGWVLLFPFLVAVPLANADTGNGGAVASSKPRCGATDMIPALQGLEEREGAGIILAPADWGSEIVFRTDHRVVGSPYHRNERGLLDTYRFMKGPGERVARSITKARGIDWVVTCTDLPWFPAVDEDEPGTLYARLAAGAAPEWLRPVRLPESLEGSYRLFRVEMSEEGGAAS